MSATINLKEIEQKAYRDSQQDGLMEIMMGLILMAFGGFFYSTVFVFYILLILFSGRIVEFFRKRYIYPRIGFVKFRQENPKAVLTGVLLFEFAVIVIIFTLISLFGDVKEYSQWVKWSPLIYLVFMGGFLFLCGLVIFTRFMSKYPLLPEEVSRVIK